MKTHLEITGGHNKHTAVELEANLTEELKCLLEIRFEMASPTNETDQKAELGCSLSLQRKQ